MRRLKGAGALAVLTVVLAANLASVDAAHATGPTPIYGGGGQNHTPLLRAWGDCAGTPVTGQTLDVNCTNAGVYSAYEYLWAGVNAGQGITSFLNESAPSASVVPSVSPYQDTARGFTYPYAKWHITNSDAPLDTLSTVTTGITALKDYQNTVLQDGFTDQKKRGAPWQYPFAVTPIDVIFNKTNFDNLQLTPAPTDGEEVKLQLSRDAICFIYTKHTAKGAVVSGAYDWSNPIFKVGNNNALLLKGSETLPIVAYHRPDAAGQTYVFALYLQKTCKSYASEGYSTPAVTITWPSYVLPAPQSGSGGIVKSVNAQAGAIAYVGPSYAEPVLQPGTGVSTAPSAYVQTNFSTTQYVAPSGAAVQASMADIAPPNSATAVGGWGASLDQKFFKASASGGYPIVGLAYLIGYQCYADAATVTGIQDLVRFYTQPPTGGSTSTEADLMLAEKGFVSLAFDKTTNSAGNTFPKAVYAALTSGAFKIVAVDKKAPTQCPKYFSDNHRS
jgi:ABC-type phosphate transport system substrate-binding protein